MGNLEFDVENRTLGSVGGRNSRRAGVPSCPGPLSVDFVRVTGPAVACLLRAGHDSRVPVRSRLESRNFELDHFKGWLGPLPQSQVCCA